MGRARLDRNAKPHFSLKAVRKSRIKRKSRMGAANIPTRARHSNPIPRASAAILAEYLGLTLLRSMPHRFFEARKLSVLPYNRILRAVRRSRNDVSLEGISLPLILFLSSPSPRTRKNHADCTGDHHCKRIQGDFAFCVRAKEIEQFLMFTIVRFFQLPRKGPKQKALPRCARADTPRCSQSYDVQGFFSSHTHSASALVSASEVSPRGEQTHAAPAALTRASRLASILSEMRIQPWVRAFQQAWIPRAERTRVWPLASIPRAA